MDRISTGSTLLDCELGGGFPLGRFVTVSGWQSTGKTGIAIDACANFASSFPEGRTLYIDSENAFDEEYGRSIGLPDDLEVNREISTIEELDTAIRAFLKDDDGTNPGLIILDSLDALSTNKEKETELVDMSGYGAEKAKLIGQLLRNVISDLAKTNTCLLIIQQLRDNITGYGPKGIKSGGKSIGFYATQEIELKRTKVLPRTIDGVTRDYGADMKFQVKKNKVGPQFGEGDYLFLFDFGVDDTTSCVQYLKVVGKVNELPKEFIMGAKDKVLEKESAIVERIEKTKELEEARKKNDTKLLQELKVEIKANRHLVSDITKKVWTDVKAKHEVVRVSKY